VAHVLSYNRGSQTKNFSSASKKKRKNERNDNIKEYLLKELCKVVLDNLI
jgi:hypothetical protein